MKLIITFLSFFVLTTITSCKTSNDDEVYFAPLVYIDILDKETKRSLIFDDSIINPESTYYIDEFFLNEKQYFTSYECDSGVYKLSSISISGLRDSVNFYIYFNNDVDTLTVVFPTASNKDLQFHSRREIVFNGVAVTDSIPGCKYLLYK